MNIIKNSITKRFIFAISLLMIVNKDLFNFSNLGNDITVIICTIAMLYVLYTEKTISKNVRLILVFLNSIHFFMYFYYRFM